MTEAIGPGSRVIFVGYAGREADDDMNPFAVGGVYEVLRTSRTVADLCGCGGNVGLRIRGHVTRLEVEYNLYWCACGWRPTGGTDAAVDALRRTAEASNTMRPPAKTKTPATA